MPREIVIAPFVLSCLPAWRATSEWTAPEHYVLVDAAGRLLGIEGLKNAFADLLEAARGERWLTSYSCRHSLNTALLAAGLSPLLVQTYLGWSSQEARILTRAQAQYTHLQLFRLEDAARKIDELYGPKKKPEQGTRAKVG